MKKATPFSEACDFLSAYLAVEHPGSWWPDWLAWLKKQGATEVPARAPGGGVLKPLEDAPGSYVKMRA